jgi:hypothetical protein
VGSVLSGELRRMPATPGWRVLQALTLWLFFVGVVRVLARFTLGYRHQFSLTTEGRQLILDAQRTVFGRTVRTTRTVLPVDRLQELTLEKSGESPAFSVGLASLILGTFLGARLFTEGVRAPGSAPWLLGLGALFAVSGLGIDYLLGSGRTVKTYEASPQLVLRLSLDRGWVLSRLTPAQAQAVLAMVQRALLTGEDLLEPSGQDPGSEPAPVSATDPPNPS